jgi:hypothetical protein
MSKRFNKNSKYSGLQAPSDDFFNMCVMWTQVFEIYFYSEPTFNGICQKLIDITCNIIKHNTQYEKWYQWCETHRGKIMKRFFYFTLIMVLFI